MNASRAAALTTVEGEQVVLKGMNVEAKIHDLLADVTVTQTYRNEESVNIEAVYTFPLPMDAVLLDFSVTMGERQLRGQVVEKSEAEERYEEAITDGDAAIMLQQLESGLYTMNVGNLQAGESVVIRFRYALLQRWTGNQLRFMLPTTIAPRYGDAGKKGLLPHQQPEYDLLTELDYSLRIVVSGVLSMADIASPTHVISIAKKDKRTIIQLAKDSTALDRDFVVNFQVSDVPKACSSFDHDRKGYVGLVSFKPEFDRDQDDAPRSIKIVVDCSGSMGGDSIAQAREALQRILDTLRSQDHFNIVAFGSHYKKLYSEQVPVTDINLKRARQFVANLDADMGGTKIGEALQAAYALSGDMDGPHDLLLITDGEVWDSENVLHEAKLANHRIFTVGVGSAVAEPFVRQLAETCGGACELVTPNENMAERIHRHFHRMYSPRAKGLEIRWPTESHLRYPEKIDAVYAGDTIHSFAWFEDRPEGKIDITITLPNGSHLSQHIMMVHWEDATVSSPDSEAEGLTTLARIAASARLRAMDVSEEASELALQYQLMSRWTHYLVIDVREEDDKTNELPSLRKVPQMMAAGWGGLGSTVVSMCMSLGEPTDMRNMLSSKNAYGEFEDHVVLEVEDLGTSEFLRSISDEEAIPESEKGPQAFVELINQLSSDWYMPSLRITSLEVLEDIGLPKNVVNGLRSVVDLDGNEEHVVITFLYMLAKSSAGNALSRDAKRCFIKAYKDSQPDPSISNAIMVMVAMTPTWDVLVTGEESE
jgi:Ca-activated chloride channel homolog